MSSPRSDATDLNTCEGLSRLQIPSSENSQILVEKGNEVKLETESSGDLLGSDLQSATSTTNNEIETNIPPVTVIKTEIPSSPSDPSEWSVDDVMRYLISVDSGLSVHAQLFQKHVNEI